VRKSITLRFNTNIESQEVYIDVEKFETIINNLVGNAFKFTPENGDIGITIQLKQPPLSPFSKGEKNWSPLSRGDTGGCNNNSQFVQITITNTGPGIPTDKIEKIFDRFYQIDDSYTKDEEGTGIGLALTKELVELHHGTIDVHCTGTEKHPPSSPFSKGDLFCTTFKVFLPLGKEHLNKDEIIDTPFFKEAITKFPPKKGGQRGVSISSDEITISQRTELPEQSPRPPIILIVEDNADLRQYIFRSMEQSYRIMEAENGEEGLDMAIKEIPDLIISDVMMPKMDGFEFCAKIKTDQRTSHIPLILLTARAAREDKIEGLETGADDYLSKPFDVNELLVRVKNLIEQRCRLRAHFEREVDFNPSEITVNTIDEQFIMRVVDIIERYMDDMEFNVEKFSKEVGISRRHLNRKLQALTNHSAREFIRIIRLKRAAQLLQKKSDLITQIAYQVGFKNLSYFAECFRKQFGQSPSEYTTQYSK